MTQSCVTFRIPVYLFYYYGNILNCASKTCVVVEILKLFIYQKYKS